MKNELKIRSGKRQSAECLGLGLGLPMRTVATGNGPRGLHPKPKTSLQSTTHTNEAMHTSKSKKIDNVEPQEDNEYCRYSSNHGHPSSIASLSPLHKPKSLALPMSLAQRPSSKLDDSTSNQYNAYNSNQDDERLKDIHPITNDPIDSPPALEQGTGSAIDDDNGDDRTMTNPNDFQNDTNQSFLDDFSPHERDGLSAVEMHNTLDQILREMYSIQIQNAILMDTLVLMGSDL